MQAFIPVATLSVSLLASAFSAASGAFVAPSEPAAARAAASGQCRAGETVIYSCRFGRSVGSVCAGESRVHYRFGPQGRPELELASAEDWGNVRVGRVVGQMGGHQSHVRFTNGRHHYIVFEGVDGEAAVSPGRRSSGIHVAAGADGSESIANLRCRGGESLESDLAEAVLARAPEALRRGDALWEERGGPFDAWY